jgi:predicted transcriptional regulator
MSTTQGIKLDEETTNRLKTLAQQRSRSAHWVMRTAILDYLDREERYEKERQEDAERWEHYVLTGKAISEEKAESRLKKLIKG